MNVKSRVNLEFILFGLKTSGKPTNNGYYLTLAAKEHPRMSENASTLDSSAPRAPRTSVFRVLGGVLVGLEALVVLGAALWLLLSLFAEPAFSLVSAIALFVLVAICAAGVCAMAIGIFRGQRWARSGGIVVQVLIIAIAGGAASDQFGDMSLALKIGIPALVTFFVLIAEVRSLGRADAAARAARAVAAASEDDVPEP